MNGIPKVTVTPDRLTVRPGEPASVEVVIQNTSKAVEHYNTSVVGLPGDKVYECDPSTVKLRPGESGTVSVTFSVPEHPAPDAGLYTLGVLVQAPYQRRVSRCEELKLDVQPAPGISVEAQPELATGGGTGSYGLRLGNDGNTGLDITLTGTDPEGRVKFFFRPRSVRVAPNASAPAQLTVQAAAPWTGQELRRTLTVRASAGTDLAAEKTITFVQRPRIPGGPLRFVGIALAVGVLATAILVGALMRNAQPKNGTGPNASMTQTGPAAGPPLTQVPGSSAPPAGGPSSAAPSTAGSATGPSLAPVPAGAGVVDPGQLPDGKRPKDGPISGDLWAAAGVKVSVNLEGAPPACADANAVVIRLLRNQGALLSSASPATVEHCNTLPLRFTFSVPVRSVFLSFLSYRGGGYQMSVLRNDGKVDTKQLTPPVGQIATLDYEAPPETAVVMVQFGHTSTDPNATDPTFVKRLVFTTAKS